MKTTTTTYELSANNNTAKRFIAVMGSSITRKCDDWGDGDCDYDYTFNNKNLTSVGWLGDDSIGACIGAYMDDGSLVGIFNYGDEGDQHVAICDKYANEFIMLCDMKHFVI